MQKVSCVCVRARVSDANWNGNTSSEQIMRPEVPSVTHSLSSWVGRQVVHLMHAHCVPSACAGTHARTHTFTTCLPHANTTPPPPLPQRWRAADRLSADIIDSGPMWRCIDDPRGRRCKQTLLFIPPPGRSLGRARTHTHTVSFHLGPRSA